MMTVMLGLQAEKANSYDYSRSVSGKKRMNTNDHVCVRFTSRQMLFLTIAHIL